MYAAGANYTANASDTLYAIWKANTYTVKYDANGGTGAPANQTKTYGVTLKLSTAKPTRTNYNFLGWGTSTASTTVAYAPGADYTGNSAITLYAVWELAYSEPIVTGLAADRCTASGTLAEDGQYAKVVFNWQIDAVNSGGLTDVKIQWKLSSDSEWNSITTISGGTATSGTVSNVIGNNALDTEYDYDIQIIVTDAKGNATYSIVLPAMKYIIDFLAGGNGVRIGGPARNEGFEVAMKSLFEDDMRLKNNVWFGANTLSGDFSEIIRMNESDQVELNWTSGGMKGRMMKTLWEGTWSVGGQITISELPYYNMFIFYTNAQYLIGCIGVRSEDGSSIFAMNSLATGGASYQNLYTYSLSISILTSTSVKLGGFSRYQIYENDTQKYPDLQVKRIVGIL